MPPKRQPQFPASAPNNNNDCLPPPPDENPAAQAEAQTQAQAQAPDPKRRRVSPAPAHVPGQHTGGQPGSPGGPATPCIIAAAAAATTTTTTTSTSSPTAARVSASGSAANGERVAAPVVTVIDCDELDKNILVSPAPVSTTTATAAASATATATSSCTDVSVDKDDDDVIVVSVTTPTKSTPSVADVTSVSSPAGCGRISGPGSGSAGLVSTVTNVDTGPATGHLFADQYLKTLMAPPRYQSAFMDPCTTSTSSASFPPDVGIVSKEEKQTASHVHGSDSSSPLAIVTTTSPTFSTAVPQDQAMTHPEGIPTTAAKPSITSFTQALIQAQAEALLEAQKARESKPPKSSCHTTSIPSRSTPSSPHLEFSTTVTSQTPDKVPSAQQCVVQKDSASNHELAHTPRMQSAPPASSTQIVDTAASSKNTTLATCSATSVVAPDSHGPKCTVASPVTPSLASSESAASHTESVTSPFLSVDPVDDGAWEELFGAAMRDSSLDVGAVSLEDEIERIKSDEAFARKLYNEDLARLKKLEEQERQDEEVARKMQESAAPLPTPASVIAPRSLSPLPSSTGLSDAELAKSFYDEEQHFLKKKLEMEKRDAEIARKMQDEATKTGPPTSTTTTSTTSTDSDPSLALALSLQQEELRILEDTERKDAALARKLAAEEDSYKTPTVHYKAPAGYLTPPPSFVGPPALFPPFGGTLPFPPLTLPVYSTPITTSKPPEIEIAVPQVLSGATVLIISPKSTSPQTVLNLTTSITAAGGRVVKKKVPAVTHVLAVDDEFSAHYQRWLSENPSIKLLTEGELKSMTKPPASLSSSTSAVIKGTPITPTMVIDALSQVSVALGGIMQFGRPAGWKPRVSPVASETLKSRFVAEYENLRDRNGPGNEGLTIAFHGTGKDREQGILSKGLLVPGSSSGVKHRTDSGWYGRGIYLSPQASMAVGYGASGCVFICAVLRGIVKHLTSRLTGKPCLPGYDSHESPDKTEWVIFKSSQILPLYLLRMV